jgi:hypothetical protein
MRNPRNRGRSLRSNRGAAVVELSVLMMVFVPLVLLPLYFQDSLRYRLDLQEAVGQTVWDFAYQDYENSGIDSVKGAVRDFNRRIHNNLWSGNDKTRSEPTGPWANFTWRRELECTGDKNFGNGGYMLLSSTYHNKWTQGGRVTCHGQIGVKNHYLPTNFFQPEFTETKLFAPSKDELVYPTYVAAVMVDSWAVNGCKSATDCPRHKNQHGQFRIKDGKSGASAGGKAFYDRTESMWKGAITYWGIFGTYLAFIGQGVSDEIISPLVLVTAFSDGFMGLDNPLKLKMAVEHNPSASGGAFIHKVDTAFGPEKFYSLPYLDGKDDMPKKMHEKRENNYLGCQGGIKPNC